MSIFNKLQFDDIDSLRNGVYITGEAVYNSPERDVELIEIPGRNGDLVVDKKRFKNIEVKYKAGAKGQTKDDFSNVMRSFRSLMASKRGYKRLTDTYNPDEFRLGTFIDAIEVEPSERKKAGEFDLIFNCKPQRFLMSGEAAVEVTDGQELFNPTPFEASPVLILEGVGSIRFNGFEVTIENNTVGDVYVNGGTMGTIGSSYVADFSDVYIATGNTIDMSGVSFSFDLLNRDGGNTFTTYTISNITGNPQINPSATSDGETVITTCALDDKTFTYGTPASQTVSFNLNVENSNNDTATIAVSVTAAYDGNKKITINGNIGYIPYAFYNLTPFIGITSVIVHSTAFTYGNPTYIDCEIGEAYAIDNGVISSLNRYIDLGANLPVLNQGVNLIDYDNTFTDVKIIPRWWLL